MSEHRLRVYRPEDNKSPQDQKTVPGSSPGPETVTVTAGEIFPVLADALATGRAWLKDFENDQITISYDLYEVILAYQHYQRLSA